MLCNFFGKSEMVVFVGKSQNPFCGEPPRMRTPRHRLADSADTKEKCSLLFGFVRDQFLLKRKGYFSLVFCPPSIRAGSGATILSARAWRNSPHTPLPPRPRFESRRHSDFASRNTPQKIPNRKVVLRLPRPPVRTQQHFCSLNPYVSL